VDFRWILSKTLSQRLETNRLTNWWLFVVYSCRHGDNFDFSFVFVPGRWWFQYTFRQIKWFVLILGVDGH
jgi:hypothetical protein